MEFYLPILNGNTCYRINEQDKQYAKGQKAIIKGKCILWLFLWRIQNNQIQAGHCLTCVIPELDRMRQEDYIKFYISLAYITSSNPGRAT